LCIASCDCHSDGNTAIHKWTTPSQMRNADMYFSLLPGGDKFWLRTERGSLLPARCWAHSVPDCILVGGPLGPRGRNASRRHARRAGRPRLAPRGRGRLHVAVSTRGRGGHDGPEESETPRSLPRPGLGSTRLDSAGWGGDVHSPRQARERPPSVKRGGPCLGRLGDSEARNLDGTREKNRSSWDSWNGGSEDRLVQARGG
jgi:hypothetical protein